MRKQGLGPIARQDARIFLLGSLPGDASLRAGRYYAHPTNQFWRLVGGVLGEELHALEPEARLERLAERGIGLWDVVAAARRPGSLDSAMRAVEANPLHRLKEAYPALVGVGFNGRAAAAGGRRLLEGQEGLALVDLPSSSAAYTLAFADKLDKWRAGLEPLLGLAARR